MQRQAIALNPHDPESLAQLGWRLMVRGHWEEGGTLLQEAIDRSMVVPAWYHETLAMALYLGGDLQRARDEAELGKRLLRPVMPSWRSRRPLLATPPRPEPRWTRPSANHRCSPATRSRFWADFQVAPDVIERLNAGLVRQVCNCRLLPVTPSHANLPAARSAVQSNGLGRVFRSASDGEW